MRKTIEKAGMHPSLQFETRSTRKTCVLERPRRDTIFARNVQNSVVTYLVPVQAIYSVSRFALFRYQPEQLTSSSTPPQPY